MTNVTSEDRAPLEGRRAILQGLILGTRELLADDRLSRFDIRERAVMGRLARFMVPYYRGWDIDTDHQRRGDDPKYLDILPDGEPGRRPIIPDIIVHQLGVQNNLLVVELKLSDNPDIALDLWKLEHMTSEGGLYGYSVGVHIILDLGRRTVAQSTTFVNGAPDPELSDWFQGMFAR